MNCTMTQWTISECLNERRPLPPALDAHAAACPACRAFLAASRAAADRLAGAAPAADLSVVARVMDAVERGERPASPFPARPLAWAAGLACAVLAASLALVRPPALRPDLAPAGALAAARPLRVVDFTGDAVHRVYRDEQARLLRDAAAARDFLYACVSAAPGM